MATETTTAITSFEVYRTVQHNYGFKPGSTILTSPFDGDIEVAHLTIAANRITVSDDPDTDPQYVDITVKGTGYKFNKSGKRSAMKHAFYVNMTEIEANPWLDALVKKAREEAQA